VIIQDGIRACTSEQEDIFYYITVGNENYAMPADARRAREGILKGLYLP
jgi:pyruvate dehydrogenase E1 component